VGVGSYSDICALDHLGCAAFNWGVGYRDYHSARAHAWLEDTFRMVARFVKFHRANATTLLAHTYEPDPWADYEWSAVGDFIAGDCGHEIDLADDKTYVVQEGRYFVCRRCGEVDGAGAAGAA
jgi:hypothetical protein